MTWSTKSRDSSIFQEEILKIFVFYSFCIRKFLFFYFVLIVYDRAVDDVNTDECTVPITELTQDYLRPPIDCNQCKDVKGLTVVDNITPVSNIYQRFMHYVAVTCELN